MVISHMASLRPVTMSCVSIHALQDPERRFPCSSYPNWISPPPTSLASSSAFKNSWHPAILQQGISQLNPLQQNCTKKTHHSSCAKASMLEAVFLFVLWWFYFVCLFVFTKMCNSQLLAGREPVLLAGELLRAKALGHSPVRAAQGPSTSYLPSTSLHWVLCQKYWWALGLVCYWALRAQQAGNWCLHRFFCIS